MTDDTDITDWKGDIERFETTDRYGATWAVFSHVPDQTPQTRFDGWVIDFCNGDRLTGEPANEIARRLMNAGDTDGFEATFDRDFPTFGRASDPMLDSVVYDDDGRAYRITVRGVRVWFEHADQQGDDIILYDGDQDRAGMIEDAPFDLPELRGEMDLARRKAING